jgi:nitric-oxide synthase, bacterial
MTGGSERPPAGRAAAEQRAEAEAFLRSFQAEAGGPDESRIEQVARQLDHDGHYTQTLDELRYGARVAWRNALDCIGRPHWRRLELLDARAVGTTDEMCEACFRHLAKATNGGNIQLVITVFPARRPGRRGFRIWNPQLIRYAGHRQPDGSVVGDRETVAQTEFVKSLGWTGSGGPFDVLPLTLQADDGPIRCYEIPHDLVLEVPIAHPDHPRLAELGLRWYAHPAICNQRMQVGGLSYTAAPFSGWYTVAEIAVRALGDRRRFDLLPRVAAALGLDTASDRLLWKDQAMVELMVAVLHSYDRAGVTIVDHHFAAASFVRHEERERRCGREVHGRWNRLIPASVPSTTEVFHRTYSEEVVLPNFFPQPLLPD